MENANSKKKKKKRMESFPGLEKVFTFRGGATVYTEVCLSITCHTVLKLYSPVKHDL